jgi:N-acetylmuramoyl-L-alanine amidase CwlD
MILLKKGGLIAITKRAVFIFYCRRGLLKATPVLVLLSLAFLFWVYNSTTVKAITKPKPLRGNKIVIDAGHGGIDGGTSSQDFREKDVNLSVAKKLYLELTGMGATVIMTRDRDTALDQLNTSSDSRHSRDLFARNEIIVKSAPDLFLSIHVNANPGNNRASGSIIFYNKQTPRSRNLATQLHNELNQVMEKQKFTQHLPLAATYYLLRKNLTPGVIIELGFMTNPQERNLLKDDHYQLELVRGISRGVRQYLASPDKNSPAPPSAKVSPPDQNAAFLANDLEASEATTTRSRALIALVIDDLAGGDEGLKEILNINRPLTLAVMPGRSQSTIVAEEAYQRGYQVFLHLPMEPLRGKKEWLGKGAITANMTPTQVRKTMLADLRDVPHATGFNNHMGSKVTQRPDLMKEVLLVAGEKHLIVLDSRTVEGTVIPGLARQMDLPVVERNIFLDEVNSVPHVQQQIRKLADVALKKGSAIGIGHVGLTGRNTAQAIKTMIPWLEKQGITLVFISDLVKR